MRSRSTPVCCRKGCNRKSRPLAFCDLCWSKVTIATRRALAEARERRDPSAIADAWVRASDDVKAALRGADSQSAYTRIAVLTGDRSDQEAIQ